MDMYVVSDRFRDLVELLRLERCAFAAKVRMARAMLGWSQSEFAARVGLTQRAIHMLEQGGTEPRRTTVRAIDEVWREQCRIRGSGRRRIPRDRARLRARSAGQPPPAASA
jgi:DNA-binding XRE family transcriptional regulator